MSVETGSSRLTELVLAPHLTAARCVLRAAELAGAKAIVLVDRTRDELLVEVGARLYRAYAEELEEAPIEDRPDDKPDPDKWEEEAINVLRNGGRLFGITTPDAATSVLFGRMLWGLRVSD